MQKIAILSNKASYPQPAADSPYTLKRALREAVILFLAGGLGMSTLGAMWHDYVSIGEFMREATFQGIFWIVLWMGNGMLNTWLSTKFDWVKHTRKRFILGVFGTLIYTVCAASLFIATWRTVVYGRGFWESLVSIDGIFQSSILVITLVITLFLHGQSFLRHWKASLVEAERLKRENLSARFETLKNQVNPHFLFNSFNVLSTLVYKDQDMAAKFIKKLSDLYRYVLETKDLETVSLSTELDALDSFIFLSKIRFGENLIVHNELPRAEQIRVAPLTLQMLVENAIKHNVVSKAKPLEVSLFQQDDWIVIENNLQRKNNVTHSAGIGLPNIQARYQYLTDQAVQVEEDLEHFRVKLPAFTY